MSSERPAAKHKITLAQARDLLRTTADLRETGLDDRDIRAQRANGDLHRVRRGHFVDKAEWDSLWSEGRHLLHVLAVVADADAPPVLSGVSAAAVHGLPLYQLSPERVHVIVATPGHAGSVRDLLRHEVALPDADIVELDGLRVTSAARTVLDVIRTTRVEAAQSVADAALRAVSVRHQRADPDLVELWRDDMERRLAHLTGARGVRRAREVIAFADGRAQLPGESVSRLRLREMGFRSVDLQVPVRSPHGSDWFVDFGLDDINAFGEYDGEGKYTDPELRGERDIEDAVLDEKQREDWIRGRTGRPMLRWGGTHIGTLRTFATRLAAFHVPVTNGYRLARR
ncbi:hypothetical protein QF046_001396 [Microbacterium sp. W4I4]|uniref:hypothetical protein n=1 Tax=Microbacterium sp. W4I4 TaxID=3042295 RepID=UPI002783B568|nr:hypothetical protein [Microbacterium sp. W4I4]MDQ0613755.1 hypothetical protein [Microbacterium sp. W4I4]